MSRPSPAILLLLLLAPGLGACFSSRPDPIWVDTQIESVSESVVYEVIHLSLQRAGYPVGIGADRAARQVVTGWLTSEAPFKGKGYRQKAHLTYEPSGEGSYDVSVRVEREVNQSLRPLDPRHAKWEPAPDNAREATRILQYVRSYLGGGRFEVGPRPGKRFD